uniref:SFRICE_005414 n=1 Tax=Spodoptera frugiperda TaxID=7108 RepID=A0A2H1VZ36_SPOFR
MLLIKLWLWLLFLFKTNEALLCYNCSTTQREWSRCGGDFVPTNLGFNSTRMFLVNCTGENAMCFVRSWNARARHAWIVQRGCYLPTGDDTLPRSVNIPTRAMSCKHERHAEAEYKVCLCRADWCNSASSLVPSIAQYFYKSLTYIVGNIIIIFWTNKLPIFI